MTASQIRTYSRGYRALDHEPTDFITVIQSISPLTRVGALCFIFGKFMGILAIPAAFIPSLNLFVVPLVIVWGSMVFTAIILCSADHYRKKRAETRQSDEPVFTAVADPLAESLGQEEELQPLTIPLLTSR